MFDVDINGKITITKGDSGESELFLNIGTVENPYMYELKDEDEVHLYAYAKESFYMRDSFIHKVFTTKDLTDENMVLISFIPQDTMNIKPGEYLYRIKLIRPGNKVDTVVDENTFVIKG